MDCRSTDRERTASARKPTTATAGDPTSGVFTDGSAVPTPGEGGWGAVYVVDGAVVSEASGYGGETTNNRMELTALIEAADLVPVGVDTTVYSDSNLAVQTINEWAEGWKRRGWKRKSGPVENLDLVKVAYEKYRSRPDLTLVWIRAHVGYTWNEYADELANRARAAGR
jgi:ribonuclease HI